MSYYLVTMTSFCSQRGEGVKKGQKIAVILNVWPFIGRDRDAWVEIGKEIKRNMPPSDGAKFDLSLI